MSNARYILSIGGSGEIYNNPEELLAELEEAREILIKNTRDYS